MFAQLFMLNIKTFAQQKVRLIVLFLLILLLPGAVGLIGHYFLTQGGLHSISVAIVDLDDGFETRMILSAITEDAVSGELFEFVQYSPEDARVALDNGDVTAIITFPEHFGHSMIVGENIPFTILYNSERPLMSAMVQVAAEAFADMLQSSQMGVYVTLNFANTQDITSGQFDIILMAINMRFLGLVLDRGDVFVNHVFAEGLSVWQAYFMAMVVAFMLCAVFVMTDALRRNFNRFVLMKLANRGISAIVLACFAAYFLLIAPMNILLGFVFFGFWTALAMVIVSAALAAFGTMIVFLFNTAFSAGSFSAVFIGASLFLSGGVIPIEFFSDNLRMASHFVFNTWAIRLISVTAIGENFVFPALMCGVFALAFGVIGFASVQRSVSV